MWLWIMLGVLLLLALALFGAAGYFFNYSIIRSDTERTDREYEDEESTWNPFEKRMAQAQKWMTENTEEHVSITSFDGFKLSAIYIPAPMKSSRGIMILFHGYRSLATIDFALEAEFLNGLGYGLIIPYQRSHGESEGRFITYGVRERFDCRDWIAYANQRFGRESNIFLGGISMGAATVLMATGLELPENVRGVMADCGFTSPWDIMKHVSWQSFKIPSFPLMYILDLTVRIRAGFSIREADTLKAMEKNRIPILFIHGRADDFVPTKMTEKNYDACRAEKELYLVEGAGHAQSFAMDTPGCKKVISGFIRKHEKPYTQGK